METAFPIKIIPFRDHAATEVLILEVRTFEAIDRYKKSDFSLSDVFVKKMEENLSSQEDRSLEWYPDHPNLKKIIFFYPDPKARIMDTRSEFLREKKHQTFGFCADGDITEAFEAFALSIYQFHFYKTEPKRSEKYFIVDDDYPVDDLKKHIPLYLAIYHARDIVNMPAQDLYPKSFVEQILIKKWKHFDVHVFGEEELQRLGCNLLLAVGAGSGRETQMVVLTAKNPPKTEKYALIGKGVTFDSGGVQIKPDKGMHDMKCDMAGGAAVLGVAEYLDTLDTLPVDIVLGIGLAENMTGGLAFKPLDVYEAYNKTTVEIQHTDAEGRLVLADVMAYIEKNYHPDHLITIATLTGACIYALGHDISGIVGDDEFVIHQLVSSPTHYETVWRLPHNDRIKKVLESDIADIANLTDAEKAGSSLGWGFLSYFQGQAKFTHIDIAGPSYRVKPYGYMPQGGTGWGVKLLSDFFLSLR